MAHNTIPFFKLKRKVLKVESQPGLMPAKNQRNFSGLLTKKFFSFSEIVSAKGLFRSNQTIEKQKNRKAKEKKIWEEQDMVGSPKNAKEFFTELEKITSKHPEMANQNAVLLSLLWDTVNAFMNTLHNG